MKVKPPFLCCPYRFGRVWHLCYDSALSLESVGVAVVALTRDSLFSALFLLKVLGPSRQERSARRWGLTSLLTCHNKTVTARLSLTPPLVSVTPLALTIGRANNPSHTSRRCPVRMHRLPRWKASQVKLPVWDWRHFESPPLEWPVCQGYSKRLVEERWYCMCYLCAVSFIQYLVVSPLL